MFNIQHCGSISLRLNSFYYSAKQLFKAALNFSDINHINLKFANMDVQLISSASAENIFNEFLANSLLSDFIKRINPGDNLNVKNNVTGNKSFTISFNTDEENYNFDTGFFILISSIIIKHSETLPFIFKIKKDDYNVNLFVYYDCPEPVEYGKIISGETGNDFISSLFANNNTEILLREFIEKKRLHTS